MLPIASPVHLYTSALMEEERTISSLSPVASNGKSFSGLEKDSKNCNYNDTQNKRNDNFTQISLKVLSHPVTD